MHPDVVGVRVELAVVGVGDDDLRPLVPDDRARVVRPPRRAARWRSCRAGRWSRCRACRSRGSRGGAATRSRSRRRWRWSSAMRTSGRLSRTSGVSTAGLRMSPASPPVQHTSTHADAFGGVLGDRARALRRLVVGMRVDCEQAQRVTGVVAGAAAMRQRRYRTARRPPAATRSDVLLGALERPDLDPADVADAAGAEPLPRERRVVGERGVQLARTRARCRAGPARPGGCARLTTGP